LNETGIKVNSADPSFTVTGLNSHRGAQTIPEGAAEAIRLALLPDDGPTGTSSHRRESLPAKAGFEFGSCAVAGLMPTEHIPSSISKTRKAPPG